MSIYQSTKVLPYVYWLTHKETGQFYIGYREANLVPSDQDLGFFYFTSSKQIKTLKFENFDHTIVAEFFDADSAWNQEQRIIEEHIKNPLCLNGHFVKDGSQKFGKPHGTLMTIETKDKLSKINTGSGNSNFGTTWSEERRLKYINSVKNSIKCSKECYTPKRMKNTWAHIYRTYKITFTDNSEFIVEDLSKWCKETGHSLTALRGALNGNGIVTSSYSLGKRGSGYKPGKLDGVKIEYL